MPNAGWYLDPADDTQKRFYDGAKWVGDARPVTDKVSGAPARPFPADGDSTAPSANVDRLASTASIIYVISFLAATGALVGGIVLAAHSIPVCDVNPYDSSLVDCSGSRHPFAGAGITIAISGLVQAFVILTVAQLCRAVAQLRIQVREHGEH